ncbi:hypothetical protein QA648_36155 (plasmid) [Rhizobium sp. CB3171]|uniref:hypothetical protein n=1 Tax=Rhizobium sp. CB3171 TaxID=3039157 RepID=UPI0024B258D3|nr:hypothetical protein [Rhizobium sp. CB3171]WFU07318.1 hypothetical protein QA648_36155 [Rhizobium sp. CB3171]
MQTAPTLTLYTYTTAANLGEARWNDRDRADQFFEDVESAKRDLLEVRDEIAEDDETGPTAICLERIETIPMTELNAAGKMDKEIASVLNAEGFLAAQNCAFKGDNVWLLRRRWGIPTVKINGTSPNPFRWPDGTYSVQGAAAALGITPQTIFKYLGRGLIQGRQLVKGQPWQIELTEDQIDILRARAQRNRRSRKQAS